MEKPAQAVLRYIRKQDLLRAGDRLGVAVSGGADSVALLRLLLELRHEIGVVISVVHLNHQLRGAESDGDEQFVRGLAGTHGLECICESRDVNAYATEKGLSLEAAAREVRYRFFDGHLGNRKLDKIATAHTLDDQAETVLLKLARGAGTRGLAGIYPKVRTEQAALSNQPGSREPAIVRPLLEMGRKRLEIYLGEIGRSWREDASNRDLRHTRNRMRHGILPRLERHVNPAVRETLAEAAEIARAEEGYWTDEIARRLPEVWKRTETGGVLSAKLLDTSGLALRRRLVRAAAESLGLNLDFQQVEKVLGLEDERRTMLPQGWVCARYKHKEDVWFEPITTEDRPFDYEYDLPVPGSAHVVEAGLIVETALPVQDGLAGYNPEHLLDLKFVQRGLAVRNWRAGERFWPLHTKEPKKIKELLQDRHITGEEKKRWPVVASGDEIVWVAGLGVGRGFRAVNGDGILIRETGIQK